VKNDTYYFNTKYYLPEKYTSSSSYNSQKYNEWTRQKHLILTPGNVTDYDYILKDILTEEIKPIGVYYDPYNSTQFAINAASEGLNMVQYSQSLASFNKPTKELERLVLSGKVIMNENPINLFCYRNVKIKSDWNGNIKPFKDASSADSAKKIDGVISQLMALAGHLLQTNAPRII
jgi:phage terminase large subunit-like protein